MFDAIESSMKCKHCGSERFVVDDRGYDECQVCGAGRCAQETIDRLRAENASQAEKIRQLNVQADSNDSLLRRNLDLLARTELLEALLRKWVVVGAIKSGGAEFWEETKTALSKAGG